MRKNRLEQLQKELSMRTALRNAYDGDNKKLHLTLQSNIEEVQFQIDELLKPKTKKIKKRKELD